jgi:hypothetical protein
LRTPVSLLLAAALAVVAVAGLLWIVLETDAGTAPASGQQTFDAPGCAPPSYAGPGRQPRHLLRRNCPNPVPVVLHRVRRVAGGWRVRWDASRSFDPMGGELVGFEWNVGGGVRRLGAVVTAEYRRPGPHGAVVYVTDDSGQTGTVRQEVVLR